jgi:hypothetical protein
MSVDENNYRPAAPKDPNMLYICPKHVPERLKAFTSKLGQGKGKGEVVRRRQNERLNSGWQLKLPKNCSFEKVVSWPSTDMELYCRTSSRNKLRKGGVANRK